MPAITIPAHDRHGVRVFAAALSPQDLQRDKAALAADLLGDPDLDPAYIEIFDVADLSDLGLAAYLTEGQGIPEPTIAPDLDRLEGVTGPVLILLSKALHGRAVTLHPDPRLSLIGTYAEDRPPVHFEPLPTGAAQGTLTRGAPPDARPFRLPGAFFLLLAALALSGLVALFLAAR